MSTRMRAPERGDAVWVELVAQPGHEQSGRRPALVVSPVEYNRKVGLALLCPITTRIKDYPFEVRIPEGGPVQGVVLSDQVKSLDWRARKVKRICRLPAGVVDETLAKLGALLAH